MDFPSFFEMHAKLVSVFCDCLLKAQWNPIRDDGICDRAVVCKALKCGNGLSQNGLLSIAWWEQEDPTEKFLPSHGRDAQGGTEVMKSQNTVMDVEGASKAASRIVFLSDIEEEERRHSVPTSEEIRQRAFEIYIERGRIHGSDLGDWMQAERELQEKYKETAKAAKGSELRRWNEL
jgi:Protein of unknown function (DUF2934)